ncbi:phytoene desaturase family protein [Brevibacterium luteolum]|uniref:phytoene desaturase family protein n=1 Tax=Brevibacterium luteolum TaxID=199591 RepID=UPI00223AD02F|nr:NAD(P)/FAD-dependent oxidoreductase [Brevibacterium luteolum]MCT1657443.1 NAD(P)/FAD-dependent oxidoreductase [Brevibacterium luteolum]
MHQSPAIRRSPALDAVIVGSGPNGLAAAVTLARAGLTVEVLEAQLSIGGGARTLNLGLAAGRAGASALRHDVCSAVHPMALASPFLLDFDLAARGVELAVPEISYAQPLDDQPAALAWRDLDRTAAGLGADGLVWKRFFAPFAEHLEEIVWLSLGDKRSLPAALRSPAALARSAGFAARLFQQGSPAWNLPLRTDAARALFTGVASHAIGALPSPATAAAAMLLATLAHGAGWPIPVGGSQAITDALAADLKAHGGQIRTGVHIETAADLPPARTCLLDTSAGTAARIWDASLPASVRGGLRRFGHGDAAAKVDFVLSGPVPWRDRELAQAGTLHLGGTREQMAAAEAEVTAGRLPQRPVVLVSDPTVADPSRQVAGLRPLWTYAHVPAGCPVDVTEHITAQIERFAPGFRDVIVDSACVPAAQMHAHNENYAGGDIAAGTVSLYRMVARPRLTWDPYSLGIPGVYLCSAATPPGPGVHGMNGWFAAQRALKQVFGLPAPRLAPDR